MPNIRSSYTDRVNFFGGENPLELAARFGRPCMCITNTFFAVGAASLQGFPRIQVFT